MSKGKANSGIRMTQARREALAINPNLSLNDLVFIRKSAMPSLQEQVSGKTFVPMAHITPSLPAKEESETEIEQRLNDRFNTLSVLTQACVDGEARSLIVSGPAGLGKTFAVEQTIKQSDMEDGQFSMVSGYVRATGLYRLFYKHRHEGNVIVLDDADAIFYDDISLNLLKAVCDTTEQRKVSWLAETIMVDEETSEIIPRTFQFDGTIIFITNLDFDTMIARGHKLAPHLEALVSRSHYIDCGMKTKKDYLVRIKQVIKTGMMPDLTVNERNDVVAYIEKNQDTLRELSLRMALKIGSLRKNSARWQSLADVTCCRNR